MNKLIVAVFLSCLLVGCGENVGLTSMDLEKPDFAYELDTWMENSEIYEFTPRSNKKMSCVMLMLDNQRSMSLECFPKPSS